MDVSEIAAQDQLETEVNQGARLAGLLYRNLRKEGVPRKLRMSLTADWFAGWLGDEEPEDE